MVHIVSGRKQHVNRFCTVALMCLALVTVFILVDALSVQAAPPVKIAMITAKSGKAGKSNSASFIGARFTVDFINENGGILGRQVELLEYDNLSTPEGSAAAGRQAIEDGAVAVVGCNWSSHSMGLAKVMQEAKIPMISHMSTNRSVTRVGDYIFRACFTDSFQGLGLARYALESIHAVTAVVLVDKDRTYSIGLADTFTKAFEDGGGKVVWRGEYSVDDDKFAPMMETVAEHRPDILFVPGGYSDVSKIFGMVDEFGIKGARMSGDGVGIKLYEYIGNKADGVYYSSHWSKWVDTPKSKEFVRMFEKTLGPASEDSYALVHDAFMVLKDAIERAGSTDGPALRKALASTPGYSGVTGLIRFDESGDPIKPMVIKQLKFGGFMYLDQVYP